jgi:parallel beta-helix repeat protein
VGLATDGDTIIVGPGVYGAVPVDNREGTESQPIIVVADPSGAMTGDVPGPVVVDAEETSFGFRFSGSTFITVNGFEIIRATGANGAGIHIRSASTNVTIRNCVVRNNRDGVRVQNSDDVLLFNNLVIRNSNNPVRIADSSDRARLVNNTIADNMNLGVRIGDADQASTDAFLANNIIQENRNRNILIVESTPSSLDGYNGDFNLVFSTQFGDRQIDNYRPITIQGQNDINEPAAFTGGGPEDREEPDDYRLVPEGSPAIDAGDPEIPEDLADDVAALASRTTSPDNVPDGGPIDLGYHFPIN